MKKENIFQLVIVLLGIFGIAINFMLYEDWRGIFYFTILSNIYVTLFYIGSLILDLRGKLVKSKRYYSLKGFMLLSILCTMLVYFIAVNGQDNIYVNHPLECYSVHLAIPILTLLECVLFENKRVLKYSFVLKWMIICTVYTLILVGYRKIFNGTFLEGKAYPYDIINFEELGIWRGVINCLAILCFFVLIGVIIIFVDNKMKKPLLKDENNGR